MKTRLPAMITCCALLLAMPSRFPALAGSYVEDFQSLQYCDVGATTAWWDLDLGQLKLHPFAVSLSGSYDTPGSAYGVTVSGEHAFIADLGSGLRVIDISDPASPVEVGFYDTAGDAWDVAVAGEYAYVAGYAAGLQVIDISDPTAPTQVGTYNTSGASCGVAVWGDYAYVADYSAGLQIISISNPLAPTLVGTYNTPGYCYGVAVWGDYAFVADDTYGLQVINVSNPASPTLAGTYNTSGSARNVALSGKHAFVADYGAGVQVIDISNPASPTLVGNYNTSGSTRGVAVWGDRAYLADMGSGLQVVDITNPASPSLVATLDTPGFAGNVAVWGNHVYVADQGSGLQAIQVSTAVPPFCLGSLYTSGYAVDLVVSGDVAYLVDYGTFSVLNMSDPIAPSVLGSCASPASLAVAIWGRYAYVAELDNGLAVVDVNDPYNPTVVAHCDVTGEARGVVVSGDYAYVSAVEAGLHVIDISNPLAPTFVRTVPTPGYAFETVISGDYAYVADRWDMVIYDITDPASPVQIGLYDDNPDWIYNLDVAGDYAYIAGNGGGLEIVDVSDPTNPVRVGTCGVGTFVYSVAVWGRYAYLGLADWFGEYYQGLAVIDVSNPVQPTQVGRYDTSDTGAGVCLWGNYAYLAAYTNGLRVLKVAEVVFDGARNVGQSLAIDQGDTVRRARLSTIQADQILWELSADGGSHWQSFPVDGAWYAFSTPGSDLRWRSTHFSVDEGVNPICSRLEVRWLHDFVEISAIEDIPEDQGGWVRVCFTRSGRDFADETSYPIATYNVWRRIDDPLLKDALASPDPAEVAVSSVAGIDVRVWQERSFVVQDQAATRLAFPPGIWEVVGSFAATQQDDYIYATPTLEDSSASGIPYAVYCVTAHTTTPSVWYASPADSGYSVDNIAPAPPAGLRLVTPTTLAWSACPDEDFQYFTVYGSSSPDLDPGAVLIGYTIQTSMDVSGHAHPYYHVTATDDADNEGEASTVSSSSSAVAPAHETPVAYALGPNHPNPFLAETTISFDLPGESRVRLEVFDVGGRLVTTLIDEIHPSGRHRIAWHGESAGGSQVSPGVYAVRMRAGDFSAVQRVLLMR